MRILMLGDIVGRPGRQAVTNRLPQIRRDQGIDLVVANGENASGGIGWPPARRGSSWPPASMS